MPVRRMRLKPPMRWLAALLLVASVLAPAALYLGWTRLPPPAMARYLDRSTVVTDRNGAVLRGFLSGDSSWRLAATPALVDPLYLEMLKVYEDRRFDDHRGVDPLALLRAAGQALANGRIVSGASTLTMQAARLLEPRPRDLGAKLTEMAHALALERRLDKSEILSIYLTLAPFGGNLEGVRAASLAYFGKEPRRLTPGEAALLVVLPQAPGRLRPDRHPAAARAARAKVLERALGAGLIDAASAAEAKAAPLPGARLSLPFLAPHLAERLLLAQPSEPTPREVIATSLDAGLQSAVERLLRDTARALGAEVSIALLLVENQGRRVRAHAGSPDYFAERRDGMIDMTHAVRSPGSALKPFIYGLAFDDIAAHPDSLISDRPRRFGAYAPRNFDRGFSGDVTIREALQRSLNVPAVAVLDQVGPLRLERRLRAAGTPLHLPDGGEGPSLAIALGGAGVSLIDLTALYAAIADGGRVRPLTWQEHPEETDPTSLFGTAAAWYLAAILAETPRPAGFLDRAQGGRAGIAFKTGTSYGQRDAWAVGFSARYTIGVWVGRPDGAPCPGCVGIQAAAPLLFRAFALLPDPGAGPTAAPPPPGVLAGPTASLPPGLRRFDPPAAHVPGAGPPPRIVFPLDGTSLAFGGDSVAVPLKAEGGRRPLRWIVNGRPLGGPQWRREGAWPDADPGFAKIQLIDADGRSARVRVRLEGKP